MRPRREPASAPPRPTPSSTTVLLLQLSSNVARRVRIGKGAESGKAMYPWQARQREATDAALAAYDRRSTRASDAAIGLGVAAVALVATGVSLFVVAKRHARRNLIFAPGPGQVGVALQLRF